jgi:hypothetical protein
MISTERMKDIIQDILIEHGIESQTNYLLTEYPERMDPSDKEVVRYIFEIIIIESLSFEAKDFLEIEMNELINKINHSSFSIPIIVEVIWILD